MVLYLGSQDESKVSLDYAKVLLMVWLDVPCLAFEQVVFLADLVGYLVQ